MHISSQYPLTSVVSLYENNVLFYGGPQIKVNLIEVLTVQLYQRVSGLILHPQIDETRMSLSIYYIYLKMLCFPHI